MPRATPWEHLQLSAKLRRLTDWEDRARDLITGAEMCESAIDVLAGADAAVIVTESPARKLKIKRPVENRVPVVLSPREVRSGW